MYCIGYVLVSLSLYMYCILYIYIMYWICIIFLTSPLWIHWIACMRKCIVLYIFISFISEDLSLNYGVNMNCTEIVLIFYHWWDSSQCCLVLQDECLKFTNSKNGVPTGPPWDKRICAISHDIIIHVQDCSTPINLSISSEILSTPSTSLSLSVVWLPTHPHLCRSTILEVWIFWSLPQRVMPSGFFLLLRFFMRVDNVMIRVNDTRLHYQVTMFSVLLVNNDFKL